MGKPTPEPIDPSTVPDRARELVQKVKFPMLATVDRDSMPRVRPVSPVKTDGFTVYVANLKSYHKTAEIEMNPNVELCYVDEDHNQVRITGKAEVLNDPDVKASIWKTNKLLQHYLGSIDNPELVIYKIIPSRVRFMIEWALSYHEVPIPQK